VESALEICRGYQQRYSSQEEQAGLEPGADAVELLHVVFEAAEEERSAQHEQRIGNDGTGDGGLHQHVLPGVQGRQRDDQLGQVAQRGIEQAADSIAGFGPPRTRWRG